MVIVAMEASTSAAMEATTSAAVTIHASSSSTSSHTSSESPATAAGNLGIVVASLVTPLWHHISNISEVHPDPMTAFSKLEPSHLIHSSCCSVNALILDSRPPVLLLVGILGECADSVKLSL